MKTATINKNTLAELVDWNKPYVNKRVYAVFVLIFLLLMSVFAYTDIAITTRNGINVWHSIFDGKFFQYYSYNLHLDIAEGHFGNYSAMYNIVMYFLFAIWDFPLWLAEVLTGKDPLLWWQGLLYAKAILLVGVVWTIAQLKGICHELGFSAEQTTATWMLFATSIPFCTCVIVLGQYDLFAIGFMLWGVRTFIRGNEKRFILIFSVAIMFKLFAFLLFFALLVMREKQLLNIIKKVIYVLIPYFLTELPFYITDYSGKREMLDSTSSLIEFVNSIPRQESLMYYYVGVVLVLSVYCFCYSFHFSEEKIKSSVILVSFLVFAAFFLGCYANPYWFIMLEPFACILIMQSPHYGKIRQLFEIIFTTGYIAASVLYVHSWAYSVALIKFSWLGTALQQIKKIPGTFGSALSIANVLSFYTNPEVVAAYGVSMFVVALTAFTMTFAPKIQECGLIESRGICKGLWGVRIVIGICFSVLPILCFFYL